MQFLSFLLELVDIGVAPAVAEARVRRSSRRKIARRGQSFTATA